MDSVQRYFMGFFMVRITFGIKTFWKVTQIIYVSKFYLYDQNSDKRGLRLIPDLINLFEAIGLFLSYFLQLNLNKRTVLVMCLLLLSNFVLMSQFTIRRELFVSYFSFSVGFSNGISLMMIPFMGFNRYKKQEKGSGKVRKLIQNSFQARLLSLSGIFGLLSLFMAYFLIFITVNEDDMIGQFYDGEDVENFTLAMARYSAISCGFSLLGVLFLNNELPISKEIAGVGLRTEFVNRKNKRSKRSKAASDRISYKIDIKSRDYLKTGTKKSESAKMALLPVSNKPNSNNHNNFYSSEFSSLIRIKHVWFAMFLYFFLALHSVYYDRYYNKPLKNENINEFSTLTNIDDRATNEKYFELSKMFVEILGLLIAGWLFDRFRTLYVAIGWIFFLLVHGILMFFWENFYPLALMFRFFDAPVYVLICFVIIEVFPINYEAVFSMAALGAVVANCLSFYVGYDKKKLDDNEKFILSLVTLLMSMILTMILCTSSTIFKTRIAKNTEELQGKRNIN
ncbi:hypothetical protein SteCoe_21749 [Stentor coeruleus]|uniref:Uncharacterized protein n=1 Tax=Stentor coeruleus TaxID=5963 RepID=A0A1R2BNS3_9CILI|nr:hypothetical protein SteCoe_21749 [Stentor coeruleus]